MRTQHPPDEQKNARRCGHGSKNLHTSAAGGRGTNCQTDQPDKPINPTRVGCPSGSKTESQTTRTE